MFDAKQIQAQRHGASGRFAQHEPAGSSAVVGLQHRTVFIERAEFRRQVVKVSAQMQRLEFSRRHVDDLAQAKNVFRQRQFKGRIQCNRRG